jgi:hypothetical protein
MGNLSPFIPAESATVTAIYAHHKKLNEAEAPRKYLGASIIGNECDRYLWFAFRQCFKAEFDGRMLRLFETGHLAEPRFIKELEGIGCTVNSVDESGNQFGVSAVGGHFKGHMDAVALGVIEAPKTWHLCEFKTASEDQFAKIVKMGVKVAKPLHYAQMQSYMKLGGLTRALYMVANKNTDEIWAERIEYNATEAAAIIARAERIITANQPPERCAARQDDFRCKYCDAYEMCWGTGRTAVPLPAKTCRTCCHATPELEGDGRWTCKRKAVMEPCGDHLLLPWLVLFAEAVDAGESWIEFRNHRDGAVWRHGTGEDGTWTTEELMQTPGPVVGRKAVEVVKKVFGGKVVEAEFPCLWEGGADGIEAELRKLLNLGYSDPIPDPTNSIEDQATGVFEYDGKYLVIMQKNGSAKVEERLPF